MVELTRSAYLDGIAEGFAKEFGEKYDVYRGKKKEFLDPDDQYLIIVNRENPAEFVKVKVEIGKTGLLGRYKVKITATDIEAAKKLGDVIYERYSRTSRVHTDKRRFLSKVYEGIQKTLEGWKSETLRNQAKSYREKANEVLRGVAESGIGKYLAIGIEYDNGQFHPVFGLALGDKLGGLVIFDPIGNEIEVGGFLGYGSFGIGGVHEIPIAEVGKVVYDAAESLRDVLGDVVGKVVEYGKDLFESFKDSDDDDGVAMALGIAAAVIIGGLVAYGSYRLGKYIYHRLKLREARKPWYEKYEIYKVAAVGDRVEYRKVDPREIEGSIRQN